MDKKFILFVVSGIIAVSLMGIFTVSAIQSDNLAKQLQIAKNHFESADYEESIKAFESVLELDPLNIDARLGLAESYVALSRFDEAEETLLTGIELLPKEESFYSFLSAFHIDQLQILNALEILDQGANETNSTELIDEFETLHDTIRISSRRLVQQGHSRKVSLIWKENDDQESIRLPAEWQVVNEHIGVLSDSNEIDEVIFTGEELGETEIIAKFGEYTFTRTLEVKEQVLQSVAVTPEEFGVLAIGQTLPVSVVGFDAEGEHMEFTPRWRLDDEDLGEFIEPIGYETTFKALKEGTTHLVVNYEDFVERIELVIEGDNKVISHKSLGQGEVVVSPEQDSYTPNTSVSIEAKPQTGWRFVRWEGDLEGNENPVNLTIKTSLNIQAIFEEEEAHSLSLAKTGEGEIIRSSLSSTFSNMDSVQLTARPSEGWSFKEWTGSISSTDARIHVVMDSDKSIRAVFTKNEPEPQPRPEPEVQQAPPTPTYTLSLNAGEGGQIQKDRSGNQFQNGTRVALTAVPNSGWKFVRWEGAATGTSRNTSVSMDSNKSVRAVFSKEEPIPKPEPEPKQLTLSTAKVGEGTVSTNRSGSTFGEGTSVTLTATPAEGWEFVRWEGDASGRSTSLTVTMNNNRSITAVFAEKPSENTTNNENNDPQ
ncbi:tetratricopeptide repeat protein [Alkalihalobacillus sp. MEB130]|uniref:InlB B-repeat-containing protein n=1 Tax=Alkalihalobacillus sp. MEB130 TaxID=2976704 RepID=UPI0028DDB6D3|nr:tetratricopeptide repeat protein [Alkalihalobacillus sp. MEB130]MDT8860322.1 tetratricopeptide repeat protein [Alkalihalobacillus sp. MEB130]